MVMQLCGFGDGEVFFDGGLKTQVTIGESQNEDLFRALQECFDAEQHADLGGRDAGGAGGTGGRDN